MLGVLLGTRSHVGAAEAARAATGVAPAEAPAAADRASLLNALSFTSKREPIAVTADALEFDYRSRVLTYKGGVEVVQGDVKLQSNLLTVVLDEQSESRVKEVVASGKVRVSKGARWATGARAVFDQTQHTVVLSGDAVVNDGANEVSGERVIVYLDEERSVVEGGTGRVKARLLPRGGDAPTDEARREP